VYTGGTGAFDGKHVFSAEIQLHARSRRVSITILLFRSRFARFSHASEKQIIRNRFVSDNHAITIDVVKR